MSAPSATLSDTKARGWKDMRLSTARDQFISERRIGGPGRRGLGPGTLRRYYFSISGLIDWLNANHSRPRRSGDSVLMFQDQRITEYIAHRSEQDLAPATLAIDCAALREFAKWGLRKRYWTQGDVEDMPRVDRPTLVPRPMTHEERDRIMALPLAGVDAVLRALLYYTGCRETELEGLRLLDVAAPSTLPDGTDALGFIRVYGKGRKERVVDLHPALWEVLGPHVQTFRGKPLDWCVLSRPDGTPWSYMMFRKRVLRWGKAANVPGLTAHRFRHTFATDTLEATRGDLSAVQELLGHANVNTTRGYTRIVNQRRAAAVRALPTFAVHQPDSLIPVPPGSSAGE